MLRRSQRTPEICDTVRLVGINLKARTFHFVVPEGPDYRGSLAEEFSLEPVNVGLPYVAKITEKSLTHYATEWIERSFSLHALQPQTKLAPPIV